MPVTIPNTTLLDPTAAGGWIEFAGADLLAGGFFVVANNPAEVQMAVRQDGSLPQWGASIYCPPGVYPLAAGARQPVAGVRARNFVVGSPVQFFGILFYPGEAQVLAGTPFASIVAAGGGVTPGTVLIPRIDIAAWPPAAPVDQDIVELIVSAAVHWLLRYQASDGYWYYLGGPPLRSRVVTIEAYPGAINTYVDLATVGPTITLPVAGDFTPSIGFNAYDTAAANQLIYAALKNGAAATSDTNAEWASSSAANNSFEAMRVLPDFTGLALGTVLKMQYKSGTLTTFYRRRWLTLEPIRIT